MTPSDNTNLNKKTLSSFVLESVCENMTPIDPALIETVTKSVKEAISIPPEDVAMLSKSASPIIEAADATNGILSDALAPIKSSAFDMFSNLGYFDKLQSNLNLLAKSCNSYLANSGLISDGINKLLSGYAEAFSDFLPPEQRNEKVLKSFSAWGVCGWTPYPTMPIRYLFKEPISQKNADLLFRKYTGKQAMNALFVKIRKEKIQKHDFEEAVFDFENRKYKSCAMILFSILDAYFIKQQKDGDCNNKGRRLVGKSACKKYLERLKNENQIKQLHFQSFLLSSISSCLLTMFGDAKDFKEQPTIINRNFLNHGMLHRKVSRKDCVQLFLLYYNLLSFISLMEQKS